MSKYYDYVAPDYKIRFGIGGDWLCFRNESFIISCDLKNGDWEYQVSILRPIPGVYAISPIINDVPYETLVLFRKALAIKGLEYVLDKEITLVEEK